MVLLSLHFDKCAPEFFTRRFYGGSQALYLMPVQELSPVLCSENEMRLKVRRAMPSPNQFHDTLTFFDRE